MSFYDDNEDWLIFGNNNHRSLYSRVFNVTPRTTTGAILYIVFSRDVIVMSGYAELKKFINAHKTPTTDMFTIIDETPGKIMKVSFGGHNE